MERSEFVDPGHLKSEAYADSRKYRARTSIYAYLRPGVDFHDWALSHLRADLGAVLDVGCGPGDYLRIIERRGGAGSLVGVDLSAGMLREIRDLDARLCVADAQILPFDDRSFDTVLCMHMLYHVPDIDRAIAELARVVVPGGEVLIATNASEHQRALRDAFDAAVSDVSGDGARRVLSADRRFRLEDAEEMLRAHFDRVERHDLARELVVPDVAPLLGYLESVRSFHESKLPEGVGWDEVVASFTRRAEADIERTGAFRSSASSGVLLCRAARAGGLS